MKNMVNEPQSFEFVTVTGLSSSMHRAESKKVRVQAMRDYLRKQNNPIITEEPHPPKEPSRYKRKFRLTTWSHKTKIKSANVRQAMTLLRGTRPSDLVFNSLSLTLKESWNQTRKDPQSPTSLLGGSRLDPLNTMSIVFTKSSEKLLVR